jgi:hypothetical protein
MNGRLDGRGTRCGGGMRAKMEASGSTMLWQIGHAFLSGAHEERAQRRYVAVGVCIPLRAYGSMLGESSGVRGGEGGGGGEGGWAQLG